jgi:hypothetical protein
MPNSALDALFQKAGLVDDQHPVGVAQVFGDVSTQVIADTISVPLGTVEQALHAIRALVTGRFSEGPTVLAGDRRKEPGEVVAGTTPWFDPPEPARQPRHQLIESAGPAIKVI